MTYVEWDPETKLYVGSIPGLAGAHAQASTLDELHENMRDVILLLNQEGALDSADAPHFVGLQQIEIAV